MSTKALNRKKLSRRSKGVGPRSSHCEELDIITNSRSPHPPVSTGTFSLWEKGYGILWINHDEAKRDTLRLSPQFYE